METCFQTKEVGAGAADSNGFCQIWIQKQAYKHFRGQKRGKDKQKTMGEMVLILTDISRAGYTVDQTIDKGGKTISDKDIKLHDEGQKEWMASVSYRIHNGWLL